VGFVREVLCENQREAWKRSITPRALSLALNERESTDSLQDVHGFSWGMQ
jgi:hypothetical protein